MQKFATAAQIQVRHFQDFGALADPKLGFFNLATQEYRSQVFPGMYELIALSGSITRLQMNMLCIFMWRLGGENYETISGHLLDAKIAVTAEITVIPFAAPIFREFDPEFKLNLIKTS